MDSSTSVAGTIPSREARRETRRVEISLLSNEIQIQNWPFPKNFQAGDVVTYNKRFIEILEQIPRKVDLTDCDPKFMEKIFQKLRLAGKAAYNTFLPEEAGQLIADLEVEDKRRLSLTFRSSPELSLFWEMLYAGEPGSKVNPEQFWGFRYSLGRTYLIPRVWFPDEIYLQDGIFSAIHDELPNSPQEIQRVAQLLTAYCEVIGSKLTLRLLDKDLSPEEVSIEEFIARLISDDFRYGIVHFACHADNPKDLGATHARLFLRAHAKELELSLETLKAWQKQGLRHKPLVFLNACESSTAGHLLETLSFPAGFLSFKAGGVIATACTMPDDFASAFSIEFYSRLLSKPQLGKTPDVANIGEALRETRWYFWERYKNPLGLAYCLYAVSDQKLI